MNKHFLNKRLVQVLGYAGLIPFILLTLACWLIHPDWFTAFIRAQLAYGIAILSFLGGIHWGATMMCEHLSIEQTRRALIWSVVPALVAWSSTMMGGFGFAVLLVGFVAAYQVDKHLLGWYRMPDWFLRLRFKLTCVVVAMLALTVVAANVRG
jgi:hypothetical protein